MSPTRDSDRRYDVLPTHIDLRLPSAYNDGLTPLPPTRDARPSIGECLSAFGTEELKIIGGVAIPTLLCGRFLEGTLRRPALWGFTCLGAVAGFGIAMYRASKAISISRLSALE